MAREALAKNDLHYFDQPVHFIFGKSYVPSSTTGDLFEGVKPGGVAYRPVEFSARKLTAPSMELGGPWHFYRNFWRAHDLEHLANLLGPEIMVQRQSYFTIPVRIENPTEATINANVSVQIPEGWSVVRRVPDNISVAPHDYQTVMFTAKTPHDYLKGWKTITITGKSAGASLGEIQIRVEIDPAAMPE
jgi:hypothetical protein